MDYAALKQTASAMVAPGQGILAMDESNPTCGKRLQAVSEDNTEANRIAYRCICCWARRSPGQLHQWRHFLYDETIRQSNQDGKPFTELIQKQDILIGIKVGAGAEELALRAGEKVTEGLDGLRERLEEYQTFRRKVL
ncbi:class I fructose-bisphosphate aldolase [Thiohalophilus sp.]|uniref:class I fructose-bisphosphate aldolase n=1 Tax=Thiohalophilus sp. TaxID=3028392 RepID=UPI002ACE4ED6|nr:class I fructose-bisphosphate aldolase [Thiohalophilus sp.]MDZ7803254.1 class I fructose-bisphosphate aldolase [Thiohalophilus sp.]